MLGSIDSPPTISPALVGSSTLEAMLSRSPSYPMGLRTSNTPGIGRRRIRASCTQPLRWDTMCPNQRGTKTALLDVIPAPAPFYLSFCPFRQSETKGNRTPRITRDGISSCLRLGPQSDHRGMLFAHDAPISALVGNDQVSDSDRWNELSDKIIGGGRLKGGKVNRKGCPSSERKICNGNGVWCTVDGSKVPGQNPLVESILCVFTSRHFGAYELTSFVLSAQPRSPSCPRLRLDTLRIRTVHHNLR